MLNVRRGTAAASLVGALLLGLLTFAPPAMAANQVVNLFNIANRKCADLPGFGKGATNGPVNQFECNFGTGDNQRFELIPRGKHGSYDKYLLKSVAGGLCLDLPGFGRVSAGTAVSQFDCRTSGDNQEFFFKSLAKETFQVINVTSGLCLDVAGHRNKVNDVRLTLAKCDPRDDHLWSTISAWEQATSDLYAQAYYRGMYDYPGSEGNATSSSGVANPGFDGLLVTRFFIPHPKAAGGFLHGDNRGYTADPWAGSRMVLTWDLRSGKARFSVSDSIYQPPHTASKPAHIAALDLSRKYSVDDVFKGADVCCRMFNNYYVGSEATPSRVDASRKDARMRFAFSAVNSWSGLEAPEAIKRFGSWTTDGELYFNLTYVKGSNIPRVGVEYAGNSYPAIEVQYYPRTYNTAHVIARRNISPEAFKAPHTGLDAGGGIGALDKLSWAGCGLSTDRRGFDCREYGGWASSTPNWSTRW